MKEVMEVLVFLIFLVVNMVYGRSYEEQDLYENPPPGASFVYGEHYFENIQVEKGSGDNISKRSYASVDKSICWLTGPSFALRSEEVLLYQPYENQTELILTSRDCLPRPLRISIHHEHLSTKVLHFSIYDLLYIFMDNQTIFKTRRSIISRLFCKSGHSTIIFSLANKSINKGSYKNVHRFGKRCPKSFLNNSQIRNYHNDHRRIPHMDLLFGLMIILVILVTCFLRLIYWFRIKAMSQERQLRTQQRRQLLDLTRPSRVTRRIELPPSYNEIQQQEEPPPSYDVICKRLLTSEIPEVHNKSNNDGDSPSQNCIRDPPPSQDCISDPPPPSQDCISDPPPEYSELYENLTFASESESNTNCEVNLTFASESESNTNCEVGCSTLPVPERSTDEIITSSNNSEQTASSKCINYSDQVSLDLQDLSKSNQNSTIVDDKTESDKLDQQTSSTKNELDIEPLTLSDGDDLNIPTLV